MSDDAVVQARSRHQRPTRPRAPSPRPPSQAITPPAPHTAAPLEPQAQLPFRQRPGLVDDQQRVDLLEHLERLGVRRGAESRSREPCRQEPDDDGRSASPHRPVGARCPPSRTAPPRSSWPASRPPARRSSSAPRSRRARTSGGSPTPRSSPRRWPSATWRWPSGDGRQKLRPRRGRIVESFRVRYTSRWSSAGLVPQIGSS